jgi:predicted PurR-regulated permease PerM
MSAAPGPVQRAAYRVWLAVGALVLAWIVWQVLYRPLAVVVPPLLVSTVIVYLLAPVVSGFEERGLPRWLGTLLAYLISITIVALVVALLVPLLVEQGRSFAESLPQLVNQLSATLDRRLAPLGIDLVVGERLNGDAVGGSLERALQGGALSTVAGVLGGISGFALGLLQVVLAFALAPVMSFYVLVDLPRLSDWVRSLIPPQYRDEAVDVGLKLHYVVGGFIRGQLLVALFVGIASSIGLAIIGLPFSLLIGVIAGLTNMIPLLGPFVAGALGVAVALVSNGLTQAALVVLVLVIVQQLDNQLISPLVMGRTVQLHPVGVLLALIVAGAVYGVFGLLIAVPAVAAGKVLVTHVWDTRVPWAQTPHLPDVPEEPRPTSPPPADRVPVEPRRK